MSDKLEMIFSGRRFLKKTNEQIRCSLVFVRFWEESEDTKKILEIN